MRNFSELSEVLKKAGSIKFNRLTKPYSLRFYRRVTSLLPHPRPHFLERRLSSVDVGAGGMNGVETRPFSHSPIAFGEGGTIEKLKLQAPCSALARSGS